MKKIVRIIGITMIALGVVGFSFLAFKQWIPAIACLGVFAIGIIFGIAGIKRVREEERMVVEFFGKFYEVKSPGPRWICPLIMRIRAIVSIWEQPIKLFTEKPSIDFAEGGTAVLVEPTVWVRVKGTEKNLTTRDEKEISENTKTMIYEVDDWRVAIREDIENALRDCLNDLKVDEALEEKDWWKKVKEVYPELENRIAALGLKVTKVLISDFQWSKEVVETRRKIFEERRSIEIAEHSAEAAKHRARQKALESGGMHAEIKKLLTEEPYNYSPEDAEKVAADYVKYFRGTETGRIIDWRVSEGGGGLPLEIAKIATAIEAAKEIFKPKAQETKEKKEKKEKKGTKKQPKKDQPEEDED